MLRRHFLGAIAASTVALRAKSALPNVIMIYCDDLGYGDVGCYGSKIPTPNIDKMAAEGIRFTHFYSASPVCTPSRASLLTGRYAVRTGMPSVIGPGDQSGLPSTETNIAQVMKKTGYRTMCIGKWHLGDAARHLPTNKGFDEYYGIPYSNDMLPRPLLHNNEVIEQPAQLDTLTPRYTAQAIRFITAGSDKPFFLYLPHTYPHIPLGASPKFRGKSGFGLYGDVVMELDWSVGEILRTLKENGLDDSTLVMFSSDNGPWFQGTAGALRGRKGDTFEGGMRVPFIARMPGRIPAGQVSTAFASTLDILPTVANLTGSRLPSNPLDGIDIWPIFSGSTAPLTREVFLYFNFWDIQCARMGNWKLHVSRHNVAAYSPSPAAGLMNLPLRNPELYDLATDPEEGYDRAGDYPEVVAAIRAQIEGLLPSFPAEVRGSWVGTQARHVYSTPAGALPELTPD